MNQILTTRLLSYALNIFESISIKFTWKIGGIVWWIGPNKMICERVGVRSGSTLESALIDPET